MIQENIEKIFNRKRCCGLETETLDDQRYEGIFKLTQENVDKHNENIDPEIWKSDLVETKSDKSHKKTNSTCSSRESITDDEDGDNDSEELGESEEESDFSEYSSEEEEVINAYIYDFSSSNDLFRKNGKYIRLLNGNSR